MELVQPGVGVLVGVLVLVAAAAGALLVGQISRRRGVLVAHTARLEALPEYRAEVARTRARLVVLAVLALVALVALATIAARPQLSKTVQSALDNRDIVLCLDISGSMAADDRRIVDTFRALAGELEGERIGLVVFNGAPAVVFPLTDDYDYIATRLAEVSATLSGRADTGFDPYAGTSIIGSNSAIGDGLVGCTLQFDESAAERSRTVVLASDNLPLGWSIFHLDDAIDLAIRRGVVVVAMDPAASLGLPRSQAFAEAATSTGGFAVDLEDSAAMDQIVDLVRRGTSSTIFGTPITARADAPEGWIPVVVGGFALYLLVARRLR